MIEYLVVFKCKMRCKEIIEIASILLKWNGGEYVKISEFQEAVSHSYSKRGEISRNKFIKVLHNHYSWLGKNIPELFEDSGKSSIMLVIDLDVKKILENECDRWNLIPPMIYRENSNLRKEYKKFYRVKGDKISYKRVGKKIVLNEKISSLQYLENLVKVIDKMVEDGYVFQKKKKKKIKKI